MSKHSSRPVVLLTSDVAPTYSWSPKVRREVTPSDWDLARHNKGRKNRIRNKVARKSRQINRRGA